MAGEEWNDASRPISTEIRHAGQYVLQIAGDGIPYIDTDA